MSSPLVLPPRVLVVTNMYPTGTDPTYGSFVALQMGSIAEAGLSVEVEFIDGRRDNLEYARAIGRVRKLVARGSFDLVHAHYGLSGCVAAFQPLPLVVSFCGDDLLGTPSPRGGLTLKSRLTRRLSYLAARRAQAIICKSDEMRAALPRRQDRARAHVIPNGVDVRRFVPGERDAARARLHLRHDDHLILFPNTPTERRKRVDLAEAAVARVKEKDIAARLWVVQGVQPDQMPLYYQAANCLLLTSDWEGSPNVVKEALCCDLPVLSVDAGDVRQWLALVPGCALVARDIESIAGALEAVLRSGTRVDGRPVRERLALSRIATRVTEVYAEALGQPRTTWSTRSKARRTPG